MKEQQKQAKADFAGPPLNFEVFLLTALVQIMSLFYDDCRLGARCFLLSVCHAQPLFYPVYQWVLDNMAFNLRGSRVNEKDQKFAKDEICF